MHAIFSRQIYYSLKSVNYADVRTFSSTIWNAAVSTLCPSLEHEHECFAYPTENLHKIVVDVWVTKFTLGQRVHCVSVPQTSSLLHRIFILNHFNSNGMHKTLTCGDLATEYKLRFSLSPSMKMGTMLPFFFDVINFASHVTCPKLINLYLLVITDWRMVVTHS